MFAILLTGILALTLSAECSELKFVFVMVKGPDHEACNYAGGPQLTTLQEKDSVLTEDGKTEAYELGKLLDKVYKKQLKVDKWDATKTYWAVSTKAMRTKEAALIVGAGLENNPAKAKGNWTQQQLDSTHFDAMPGFSRFWNPQQCPAYFRALSLQNQKIKKLLEKYQTTIKEVTAKFPSIDGTKAQHIWIAYETFKRMKQQGRKEVEGINTATMQKLKEFSSEFVLIALTSTDQMRKLAGGLILKDLFNDIDELTKDHAQPHAPGGIKNKMNIFVVPQAILAAQMAVFMPEGTKLRDQPITASNFYPDDQSYVIIELYQDKNKWNVQLQYKNNKNSGWLPIKVQGCNSPMCPYDTLKKSLNKYIIDDARHKQACK